MLPLLRDAAATWNSQCGCVGLDDSCGRRGTARALDVGQRSLLNGGPAVAVTINRGRCRDTSGDGIGATRCTGTWLPRLHGGLPRNGQSKAIRCYAVLAHWVHGRLRRQLRSSMTSEGPPPTRIAMPRSGHGSRNRGHAASVAVDPQAMRLRLHTMACKLPGRRGRFALVEERRCPPGFRRRRRRLSSTWPRWKRAPAGTPGRHEGRGGRLLRHPLQPRVHPRVHWEGLHQAEQRAGAGGARGLCNISNGCRSHSFRLLGSYGSSLARPLRETARCLGPAGHRAAVAPSNFLVGVSLAAVDGVGRGDRSRAGRPSIPWRLGLDVEGGEERLCAALRHGLAEKVAPLQALLLRFHRHRGQLVLRRGRVRGNVGDGTREEVGAAAEDL
mmetsp:Transcript_77238/g.196140  ORF Transcript_77238/g.196140 Transcript_77238/m.196140 type:complete len:386 (+) Transcript_77238:170-1327(+)